MARSSFILIACLVPAGVIAACATAAVTDSTGTDDGGTTDALAGDAGCPQYDITKDPLHCGTCTHSCNTDQVCSNGACKAQCTAPEVKCAGDGGGACADLTSDPNHCAQCTNVCTSGDAGGLTPGNGNPDSGIAFDGGYDGGVGWTLGAPACTKSACGITCPGGFTACSDGVCYDTQNFHDRCGDCNTACAMDTEWCNQGHCCAVGSEWCSGACVDVSSDATNCGGCGIACTGSTPYCTAGACTGGVVFSQSFTNGVVATAQCTAWTTFRSNLTGTYTSVNISGSNDLVGHTCTGAGANTICQALHSGTTVTNLSCGGYGWYVDNCMGIELTADGASCTCTNPGYNVRPCLSSNGDWGGVKTASCSAPTQTITVTCK